MYGSSPPSVVKGDRKMPEQNTQTHKLGVLPFWAEQTVEKSMVELAMMEKSRGFRLQKACGVWMLKASWAEAENHPAQAADAIARPLYGSMFWDHIGVPLNLISWVTYL